MAKLSWGSLLFLYGSQLGGVPALISAAGGAVLTSLANFHFAQDQSPQSQRPWQPMAQAVIQDLGSRGYLAGANWPYTYGNRKYYSSLIGYYSLSPLSASAGAAFPVSWAAAPGDASRVGDYVGLFSAKSTPDQTPLVTVPLQDANGNFAPTGTTEGLLVAPGAPGDYEVRYFKHNATRSVYRAHFLTN